MSNTYRARDIGEENRMRNRQTRLNTMMIGLGAVAVLTLAACGSSTSSESASSSSSESASSSAADTAVPESASSSSAFEIKPPAEVVPFEDTVPGSGEGLKVGYISLGDSIPFVRLVTESMQREAEIAGAELLVCDAALDAQKALDCARNFKTQGVESYLNFQLDTKAAPGICAAGPDVTVIAVDVSQPPCQDSFMGVDNYYAGSITGVAMGQFAKEKWNCEIDAYINMASVNDEVVAGARSAGNRDGFRNICPNDPPVELNVDAITADQGRKEMADILTTLPGKSRIVVMAMNDDPILGVMAAAQAVDRSGDVWYTGQGGDPTSHCEVLNNPNWVAETAYFPEEYGKVGIPAVIRAAQGEQIPEEMIVDIKPLMKETISEYYQPSC